MWANRSRGCAANVGAERSDDCCGELPRPQSINELPATAEELTTTETRSPSLGSITARACRALNTAIVTFPSMLFVGMSVSPSTGVLRGSRCQPTNRSGMSGSIDPEGELNTCRAFRFVRHKLRTNGDVSAAVFCMFVLSCWRSGQSASLVGWIGLGGADSGGTRLGRCLGLVLGSDKIVMKMTNAKVIDHATAPQLFNVVDEVRIAAGLTCRPWRSLTIPRRTHFATGRNPEHAVIAFTTGLLATMDREQLQGVTAHGWRMWATGTRWSWRSLRPQPGSLRSSPTSESECPSLRVATTTIRLQQSPESSSCYSPR